MLRKQPLATFVPSTLPSPLRASQSRWVSSALPACHIIASDADAILGARSPALAAARTVMLSSQLLLSAVFSSSTRGLLKQHSRSSQTGLAVFLSRTRGRRRSRFQGRTRHCWSIVAVTKWPGPWSAYDPPLLLLHPPSQYRRDWGEAHCSRAAIHCNCGRRSVREAILKGIWRPGQAQHKKRKVIQHTPCTHEMLLSSFGSWRNSPVLFLRQLCPIFLLQVERLLHRLHPARSLQFVNFWAFVVVRRKM